MSIDIQVLQVALSFSVALLATASGAVALWRMHRWYALFALGAAVVNSYFFVAGLKAMVVK